MCKLYPGARQGRIWDWLQVLLLSAETLRVGVGMQADLRQSSTCPKNHPSPKRGVCVSIAYPGPLPESWVMVLVPAREVQGWHDVQTLEALPNMPSPHQVLSRVCPGLRVL